MDDADVLVEVYSYSICFAKAFYSFWSCILFIVLLLRDCCGCSWRCECLAFVVVFVLFCIFCSVLLTLLLFCFGWFCLALAFERDLENCSSNKPPETNFRAHQFSKPNTAKGALRPGTLGQNPIRNSLGDLALAYVLHTAQRWGRGSPRGGVHCQAP